jgi:P4 family phage/plasmid primase-like protien
MNTTQFKDLNEFLAKHSTKNNASSPYTHTRIPDKNLNIYAGCYVIPQEEMTTFYNLYYEKIFEKGQKEYLTEKQLESNGPLAVDFDFRYKYDIDSRQHTSDHINDMICEYSAVIQECYIVKPNQPFHVYIFEKPHVNRLSDGSLTKDGIHMIIGLQIDHTMQLIIREKMIEKLAEIWDLPLINEWDSVLDEGISSGKTGWQLFGSRKPGNEAYELTHHYIMTLDAADNNFSMDEREVSKFDMKSNFEKLSVRYEGNPKFELNPKMIDVYNSRLQTKGSGKMIKKASSRTKMNLIIEDNDEEEENSVSIHDIKDKETLDKAMNMILKDLIEKNQYETAETHYFAQALSAKYYEPGSHLLNRKVAFALKHTDEKLFLSWVQLRSKASDFDYNSIPELYSLWKKFSKSNHNGLKVTRKTIMYLLRKDNFEAYEKIKESTTEHFLEIAFETGTEYDIAKVLRQMYKDKYVCVSYDKKGIWFKFQNHRWIPDKGLGLRNKISEDLYNLVNDKANRLGEQMNEFQEDDDRREFLKKKIKIMMEIRIRLKRTNDKNNIMREAAEIFYDGEFVRNMDTNKYLMCFDNGVVDFANKLFREGYPEDYITKTTHINYISADEENESETFKETNKQIDEFMRKLFPIPDVYRYMWDHLSSCLIGSNKNQTFNVYHGSGSNGKSILADLMSVTLGEYKGTIPITLVTDSRGKIGGTSDEVLKLKGVRYAVMQEPQKGMKLNEGIMKELTGGDPLQARGLYSESEIFEPQFSLVVCTNNLFDIESNDDGTWRRIRKCDFKSKFIDEGETYSDETPYVFIKDKSLKDKLPSFAPVFASLLVKRAFETGGVVLDCDTILQASNSYRNGQDHINAYLKEMIIRTNDKKDKIGKGGLMASFKQWFEQSQGTRKVPKGDELYEAMNKKFDNPNKDGKWHGVKFYEPEEDENDQDEEL